MAKAVAAIAFEESGTWRWSLRTESVRATTEALSRLWGRVAQEDGGVRVRSRSSVLTLVVVAPRPEDVERAMATVAMLASRHPSRAVILSPTDPDGPASFDAQVFAACHLPDPNGSEICTEEILVRIGGELTRHLSSTVAPLLIPDLPAVLWWPDDVPFGRSDFTELADECDRLFVDSGQFRDHGLARLVSLSDAVFGGLVVHDVSWMRQMLWRELLASCFDHPLLIRELRHLSAIRIDVARPGAEVRLSRAVLFVGWLMSRLRLSPQEPLREGSSETWAAAVRSRRGDVNVYVRPVEDEYSGAARAAGSIVRVELEASRPEAHTVVNVTRQADHLLATADWNGATVTRRATRLEPFDEAPYLAGSLDRTSHERIYAQALEKAVTLVAEGGR
jgi:glucose-6-phosphate dehydrogenase assembly protein OpcA